MLDYPDIFEGSTVMDGLGDELVAGARAEMAVVAERSGAVEAVPYMKTQLVEVAPRAGCRRIEAGEQRVIGQNVCTRAEPSPLATGEGRRVILHVDPAVEASAIDAVRAMAARRDQARSTMPSGARRRARDGREHHAPRSMPPAARGTTASGRSRLRRGVSASTGAPTGGRRGAPPPRRRAGRAARKVEGCPRPRPPEQDPVGQARPRASLERAEQIACGRPRRRHGRRVRGYPARRPPRSPRTGAYEGVTVGGSSIHSGIQRRADPDRCSRAARGRRDVPGRVAGISPARRRGGAARLPAWLASTTPKDFEVTRIMGDIVPARGRAQRAGSGLPDPGRELGRRLRERDRFGGAPECAERDRERASGSRAHRRAARRGLPRALGGEAPAHIVVSPAHRAPASPRSCRRS
jgi:(2R)-ethylmalonyl-CoA mutase